MKLHTSPNPNHHYQDSSQGLVSRLGRHYKAVEGTPLRIQGQITIRRDERSCNIIQFEVVGGRGVAATDISTMIMALLYIALNRTRTCVFGQSTNTSLILIANLSSWQMLDVQLPSTGYRNE